MRTLAPGSGWRLALGWLAALALAGCSDNPRLARLAPDAVVLAFGDSLTYGTGASEAESYPAQLERLPAALEEFRPKLLLLCIGGNDFLRNLGQAQVAANLRRMIAMARGTGSEVLLIGTPEKGLLVRPPKFYAEIAAELGVPYEGQVIGEILRNADLKSDPVHPNAHGYRLMAERVAELLRKAGAV
jgi:acyl-CoA thioesterase-1